MRLHHSITRNSFIILSNAIQYSDRYNSKTSDGTVSIEIIGPRDSNVGLLFVYNLYISGLIRRNCVCVCVCGGGGGGGDRDTTCNLGSIACMSMCLPWIVTLTVAVSEPTTLVAVQL